MKRIEEQTHVSRSKINENLLASIFLILILIIFYRDIVFGGRTFLIETNAPGTMPGDGPYKYAGNKDGFVAIDAGSNAWVNEPYNKFLSIEVKKGNFPLWNPYAGLAGSPFLADGQTGPLEPIQLLFAFVPNEYWSYAIDAQLLLRFFLAGLFCFIFARRQNIDFKGSISTSILFVLSSYFVSYGNHAQLKTEALLPLVLYGFDRLAHSEDKQGFWVCALLIGWVIMAAMPEATFFVLLLGTLWYFYKSILNNPQYISNPAQVIRIVIRFLGSAILGISISAAYLLPFLEFITIAKSIHAPGASEGAYHLTALLNLIFPTLNIFYLRLGFFSILSLCISLYRIRHLIEQRANIIFFSTYAIIFILTIYDFPPTNWIRNLPVFNQLFFAKYPIPSIVFCLAILSGILIDKTSLAKLRYIDLISATSVLLIIFFILIGWSNSTNSFANYATNNLFLVISVLLFIFFSIATLYVLLYRYKSSAINLQVMQAGLLIIVLLEPFYWGLRMSRPKRTDPYQTTPLLSYLQNKNEPFRIFGLDGIIYPDISTAYEIADIRWLNPLVQQRAYDFSKLFIESTEIEEMRLTGTVLPISDEMFDLLNVKFILSQTSSVEDFENCLLENKNRPYFGEDTLHSQIFKQNPDKKFIIFEEALNINGIQKTALLAHPPQKFRVNLKIPKGTSFLNFSIGLNPEIFSPQKGDGVGFHIYILENNKEQELFSKYIDPKNNPCERKWFEENISLKQWAGKDVTLLFSTDPGPLNNEAWDWAYWGSIYLAKTQSQNPKNATINTIHRYIFVYQYQDIGIYRNDTVIPRSFVIYDVVNVPTFDVALTTMSNKKVDFRRTAIVEGLPSKLEKIINKNNKSPQIEPGHMEILDPGNIRIKVSTHSPGLLVVTDQYYPGWKAYIDDLQTPIYAVNGIFRGVFLEKGDHIIEFKYQPSSFTIGTILTTISLVASILFLAINSNGFLRTIYKENKQ